ncbi:retrovirus-related pol polyprotein from transposon TNT 1-94 [Tanacetum coccineum]
MKDIFEELEAEVDQNVVNRKHDEIELKNLLIANDNLIADCLSKEVFYIATNSELTVSRFTEMHEAHTIVQRRCLELEAELSKLRDKTRSEADRTLDFRALDFQIIQLTEKVTTLQEQNELFRAENAKVKQHYKELYDSIKITRDKHIEQTTALTTKNENLKAQIHENLQSNTIDSIKPRVLAPGRYAIDVESILPNIRNNREVHLDYLKHLKESVETLREIVEEAKVERPLDRSLASACLYTKHSQELLEYAIGTCPKDYNQKDKKHAYSPLNKKKQVTFEDQCVVQSVLWYLDSGCSKHMTEDRSRLRNFMKKFSRTVRFGNDHFGAIMGYGDYVVSESVISRVYYVEGLGHNLFSVRQFCDSDLEVTLKKHFCYVRDTDGVKLIKGSRGSNLKEQKAYPKPKIENTNLEVLNTLHMDLCGPMRVQTINGKKYILVIVDDYSRFTWVKFLRTKYETPEVVIKFLKQIQTVPRTPQQKDVVKKWNRTLVEAARTMLIFSKASIVFGALCYPTNDSEDLGKLQPTTDIRIFIGYAPSQKGYRIYNKRTRRIIETIHVQFDELNEYMAPVQLSIGLAPIFLTSGQISSEHVPNSVPTAPYVPPINKELELLFQPMFDEYLEPPRVERPVSPAPAVPVLVNSASAPSSTTIDQDAPSPTHSSSSSALQSPSIHQGVAAESTLMEENPFSPVDNDPFINIFTSEPTFAASSSGDVSSAESTYVTQTLHHLGKWSKDHPLVNVIGNPSRPVSTRKQLETDALWCLYNSVLSKVEQKNFKSAITEDCWFQAMQDKIHKFDRLQV